MLSVENKGLMSYSPEVNASRAIAQQGNQSARKLDTAELRQEAYRQYCAHLASGKNKFSFYFVHPELTLTTDTMEKYLKEYSSEFDPNLMKVALAKRFEHWEEEGKKLMTGKYKHGSPVVWQTFMRNSFKAEGWDKIESTSVLPDVQITMQRMMAQITSHQQKPKEISQEESPKEIPHEEPSEM